MSSLLVEAQSRAWLKTGMSMDIRKSLIAGGWHRGFSFNLIDTLPGDLLNTTTSLTTLYDRFPYSRSSHEAIAKDSDVWFSTLLSRTYGNKITVLPAGLFNRTTSLREMYVVGWFYQDPSKEKTTLTYGSLFDLLIYRWSDLMDNNLISLPPGTFDGLTSLTYL